MKSFKLPLYLKIYAFYLLSYVFFIPFIFFLSFVFGFNTDLVILGIKTSSYPLIISISLVGYAFVRAFIAWQILKKKPKAIQYGLAEATLSTVLILLFTIYPFASFPSSGLSRVFSVEIVFAVIYLVQMWRLNRTIFSGTTIPLPLES